MASGWSKRCPRIARSVWGTTMLGVTLLTLGWIGESSAQSAQLWEFRGFAGSSVVSPFIARPFRERTPVGSNGTFSVSVPCPTGAGAGQLVGSLAGATVTGSVSGCGASQLRQSGALNGSFPAATRFVRDLEISFGEGSILTVAGSLLDGTPGPTTGATILDPAILTTTTQNRNIGLRLNSLRSGLGGGVNLSGLSLTVKGEAALTGNLFGLLPGGGASADFGSKAFGKLGVFVNGLGSVGDRDTTPRAAGFDFYTAGLTMGADYRVTDQFIVGAALGYLRTKIDLQNSASDSTVNGYSFSAYGSYYIKDQFYVDGILTYGRNAYSIDRQTTNPSTATIDRITADTDGDQFSGSLSAGYDFRAGGLTFGPTGRLTYIRAHVDGYTERGPADSAATRIRDQTVESLATALGGQLTYAISTRWAVLLPLLRAEWEHEFKGNSRVLTGTLVSDPSTVLTAQTTAPDRDYFNLGVGLSATFPRGVSAFIHYEESLGRSNFTNHSFTGGVRFEF